MNINKSYHHLLFDVLEYGSEVATRGSNTVSHIALDPIYIDSFPLITLRKTAWKKAISEMEWFMSGDSTCPKDLSDWWKGQLDPRGQLVDGYATQFRGSTFADEFGEHGEFDQIGFILGGLKNNPNSRRLIMTTWNPGEMANITEANENSQTPTCCHATMLQLFVRDGSLHIKHYQRSA